jgi:hypothetical protein
MKWSNRGSSEVNRSFTGGFTEPSMKATPGGAKAKGTTAGATRPTAPQPRNTDLSGRIRGCGLITIVMRMCHQPAGCVRGMAA